MKTKSIIYTQFTPNWTKLEHTKEEIQPEVEQHMPTFNYYKPIYNWKDPTSEETSLVEETSTPQQNTQTVTSKEQDSQQNIQSVTSSKQRGSHVFKTKDINVGNMQELLDKFAEAGISLRITSGLRPGAVTSNGAQSWHSKGYALDITPIEGQTYEDLKEQIRNSPDLIKYMKENGFGIYDETSAATLNKTNGTGFHWHIGKDKVALQGLEKLLA